MNKLDTTNSNNYCYKTKYLEIHILGGLKTNKLESLRITLSVKKNTSAPRWCEIVSRTQGWR